MEQLLDVAFKDVRADRLVLRLDGGPRAALATLTLALGDQYELELGVLGASHQVVVRGDGRAIVVESLACEDAPGWLPAVIDRPLGELDYAFRSSVERHSRRSLARRVRAVQRELAHDPGAIVGVFPGAPHAITAIATHDGGAGAVGWRTWHAYPETGEVVVTSSRVR